MNNDLSLKFRELLAFCDEGIELFTQKVKRMHPTLEGSEFIEAYRAELKKCKKNSLPKNLIEQNNTGK